MSANENTTATSQVNHAGDSTTQSTKQDTGVGSGDWFGRFFDGCDFALITKDWPNGMPEPMISFWAYGQCVGAAIESACDENRIGRMIAIRDSIRAKLSPELLSKLRENSSELFCTSPRPFL